MRMGWREWGLAGAALLLAGSLSAQSVLECERCHGELEFLRQHAEQLDAARRLLVPESLLRGTAHEAMRCTACHEGFDRFPHTAAATSSSCADCHEEVAAVWADGGHGATETGGQAVACAECHTVHEVAGVEALGHGDGMAAMVEECTACHETQRLTPPAPHAGEAPCHACHRPHVASPPETEGSGLSVLEQAETCGACHADQADAWRGDAHGHAVAGAVEAGTVGEETPLCTSCHGSHPVAGQADRHALEVESCATCHEHYAESFADSYHGQATTLGSPETATCADCHGSHGILGASDPGSMVAEANLVETCASCHPDANESFVAFQPHADYHDREANPLLYWAYTFMTALLVGTMAFFGLHTVLWLVRLGIDRARGKTEHGYPNPMQVPLDSAQRGEGGFVWRFRLYHRLTHAAVIISFFLLVFTGMPLKFSCTPWSPYLMQLLGGVGMAGLLHRIGGAITFGYFGAHLFYIVRSVFTASPEERRRMFWGRESVVPHPQDVMDLFAQFRWFLGLGPKPRFGRFSYMEKFDYFAVFWGVAIIGGTGLMLWMPELFSGFLPGWMFNVATIVHADEAMLATLFIFTIHFFNVHLRPEKFPLDAVMFTGRATVEYMEEEHPKIADRIEAHAGSAPAVTQVQDTPAPPPTRRQTLIAAILGFLALGLGLMLIGMMTWASLC